MFINAGSVNRIGEADFHRIAVVFPETWSLFVAGAQTHAWGFLVNPDRVVPHEEYDAYKAALTYDD